MRCLIAAFGLLIATPAVAAPPPQYIVDLAKALIAPVTASGLTALSASFAPDLKVFVGGILSLDGKAAWLAAERKRIGKVDRRVLVYSPGYDSLMIVDQFDDRSDLPDNPHMLYDPRLVTRALQYRFGADHLVHEIRVLQGGVYVAVPDR